MKLKKIASLALAGVMAVSMLAGCATKAPETDGNATTNTSSVVAAANEAQDLVVFTDNAKVSDALKKTVELYGDNFTAATTGVQSTFENVSGIVDNNLKGKTIVASCVDKATNFLTACENNSTYVSQIAVGYVPNDNVTFTKVVAAPLQALNEDAAVKQAAAEAEELVAGLSKTTYKSEVTQKGDKYFNYSYSGNIAVTGYTSTTGVTAYYYVIVLHQTVSTKTLGE